jgi:LuxR family maltose regulon positive regulatory protein
MTILATKLHIPSQRSKHVLRSRLIERLDEGAQRKLTLVSAPAGFGKTTVVSEWIANSKRPAAWLSLDEDDNDLARFLTYLISALQQIHAGIGQDVLQRLQIPQPPPLESTLTVLLNDIAAMPQPFWLVIDD